MFEKFSRSTQNTSGNSALIHSCSESICRISKRFNIFLVANLLTNCAICLIFRVKIVNVRTWGKEKNSLNTRIAEHQAACRLLQPQQSTTSTDRTEAQGSKMATFADIANGCEQINKGIYVLFCLTCSL